MSDIPEIFVTFPISGQSSLAIGTTTINFIDGKARLPDSSVVPCVNRIPRDRPCQVIFLEVANAVNIVLTLNEEIKFQGRVPAGSLEIDNITFDSCDIITTAATNTYVIASTARKLSD